MKKYEIDMTNGPILKKMLLFSIPLMFSGILQLLFNAADIVVLGRYAGYDSLGAVGATSSLINLLVNLFMGLSVGANVITARYYGADEKEELEKTVHTAMLISIISGVILTGVGFVGAEKFLSLMDTPDNLLPLSTLYLKIYFFGMPAMMVYNFGSAILRAAGDTKRPLYYLMISGVVNVVLNLIFVIAFSMDVAGVAAATVISQYVSALLIVRCLMNEQGAIKLVLSKLKIHWDKFASILLIGLPAGFQGAVFSLSNVVIQSSINLFGDVVVAGNSAASNIEGFIYVSMNAFHQAVISFTSQNYGAGKINRINKIVLSGLGSVFVVGVSLGAIVLLFGEFLVGIYSPEPDVIAAGINRLRIILMSYFLCGMMDVMVGALRGIGYSVLPMIVSLLGACGLRLLWIATIFQIPQYHSPEVIYLSYPVSWAITFLTHIICFAITKHLLDKRTALAEV